MNKRKGLLAVLLVMLVTVAGISAYFTDSDTATNTFTVGKIDVELQEPNWNEDNGENVLPNETVAKDGIKKYTKLLQDWCPHEDIEVNDIGKKKLAYPIKKKFTEGYYAVFTWRGKPENVVELERQLRTNDDVIKFITVKLDEDAEPTKEEDDSQADTLTKVKSEQDEKPDALDVLLGLANY